MMDNAAERAARLRTQLPKGGLFAGQEWRMALEPFQLPPGMAAEFENLGRVLLQFYRAANLLYRQSAEGRQPTWVASLLDQGKPESLIATQRNVRFKNDIPRVLRPDILLTGDGWRITELDSVPGGIGLTAWLNQAYAGEGLRVLGGARGMSDGFHGIFDDASKVSIVVSEESSTYQPEMEWLASMLGERFTVHGSEWNGWADGEAAYRFFELFDLPNIPCAEKMLADAASDRLLITPPPKAFLEEKLLMALLWNDNLQDFWRRELGSGFYRQLRKVIPRSWVMDPTPLPPHTAIPGLELTGWDRLVSLSQRERELVLKVSGFSERAWGARSVRLGHDLSQVEWASAVEEALADFSNSPWILQRYHKPCMVEQSWFDFDSGEKSTLKGRVRVCPYYFVHGDIDSPETTLGGALATVCPADKKIIHGMRVAVLAPCAAE